MTKTRAVKLWVFRHKMHHLYYSCKYRHWKGVWSILTTPWWIDFKAIDRELTLEEQSQYEQDQYESDYYEED